MLEEFPVININRLSRNLFKVPLNDNEDLTPQDFKYLYIELNLSGEQICNLFYYPYYRFKDLLKR